MTPAKDKGYIFSFLPVGLRFFELHDKTTGSEIRVAYIAMTVLYLDTGGFA